MAMAAGTDALTIGQNIVARNLMVGFEQDAREMKRLIA